MILGIDLGTTKSVVGFWQNGKPQIIPDNGGNPSIPSLVLVTPGGNILAGRKAQKYSERYSGKNITVSSVKRLIGKRGETGWGWWKAYPQEISAFILAELRQQAKKYSGKAVYQAVIAIPSHFDESQRRATREAAQIAGLNVLRFLNEATATLLAYGFYRQAEGKVLVFDLGGGALDISIGELGGGVYEVKCIEGDSKLGGDDFNQVIEDYILNEVQKKYDTVIKFDSVQKMVLREASESAKIDLSSNQITNIFVPGFFRIGTKFYDLNVSIDRPTFEGLSKNLFNQAISLIKKALNSANLRPSDLDTLLLLGGSSRIPHIRDRVREELGIDPFAGLDPEICVAQGAIIQAGIFTGEVKDVLLLEVLPCSYGIGLEGDKFLPILPKNTVPPTKISKIFTTTQSNQSSISVAIYQGESEKASENTFLNTIELTDILPAEAGIPQIEVTFNVDANMSIHVSAKHLATRKEQKVVVKSPYGLNETQIKLMEQKLDSWLLNQ